MKIDERRLAEANADLAAEIARVKREWRARQPDGDRLTVSADGPRVYRKRPKGLARVLTRLVLRIAVDASVRAQTNAQLLQWVKGELPGFEPSGGLLDQPLTTAQVAKINSDLRAMGRLELPNGVASSPSKIKMALRARSAGQDLSARTYQPTITITDQAVIVDNRSYSRFEGATRIKVGKSKMTVATLEALLSG